MFPLHGIRRIARKDATLPISRKECEENRGFPRMALLEEVQKMREQGKPEGEIISSLQEKGINPKAIQEAFNQEKIKNAVSSAQQQEISDMQPSMMSEIPVPSGGMYTPKAIDEEDYYAPQPTQEQYPMPLSNESSQEYYPQEGYQGYYSGGESSSDLMIEVAEQVFSEKIKKLTSKIDELVNFMNLTQVKVENTEERLKRIEKIIDNLQIKILEKIASYGESISGIKKEMSMMQDSFGKVMEKKTKKK